MYRITKAEASVSQVKMYSKIAKTSHAFMLMPANDCQKGARRGSIHSCEDAMCSSTALVVCSSGPALGKCTTCLLGQVQQIGGQALDDQHAFLLGQVTTTRLI